MTSLETYAGLLRTYIDNPNMMLETIIDLCIEDEDDIRAQIWRHIQHSRDNLKPCVNQWIQIERRPITEFESATFCICPNATEIKTHGFARESKICNQCKQKASSYYKLVDELIPSQFEFYSADINNLEYKAFEKAMHTIWNMTPPHVPDDELQRLYTDFTE